MHVQINRCCFADLTQAKTETQAPKQKHASRKQKHTAECQNGNTKKTHKTKTQNRKRMLKKKNGKKQNNHKTRN